MSTQSAGGTEARDVRGLGGLTALAVSAALSARTGGELFPLSLLCAGAVWAWLVPRNVAKPPKVVVLAAFGAFTVMSGVQEYDGTATVAILMGVVLVLGSATRGRGGTGLAVLLLGVCLVGVPGVVSPSPNDVVAAHRAAAERLLDGQSPYHDLGVTESNPSNYGAPIEGYSYPPLAIGVYALPGQLVGVGVVTVGLWLALVTLAVWRYGLGSLAASALALVPGMAIATRYGWTEPLTALLVLGALAVGRGERRAGLLGVAFASKQYLAFALPAVVVAWWRRRRWLVVAALAAILVSLPLLLDLSGAFDALVGFHLDRPLRPDSTNLAGYLASTRGWTSWPVPSVAVAVVAGGAGAWVARVHGEIGWLPGMAAALALTLAIGPVSLVNYWILVTVLLLLVEGERGRSAALVEARVIRGGHHGETAHDAATS